MMVGFWILIALFVAGLWWFGRASEWKTRCVCAVAPEGRPGNGQEEREK